MESYNNNNDNDDNDESMSDKTSAIINEFRKTITHNAPKIEDAEVSIYNFKSFSEVLSWKELLITNLKFILGKINKTYYHLGPLMPETNELKPILYEINRRGFYSISGQPSSIDRSESIDCYQRGYITGYFINPAIGQKFIKYICARNDCYYLVCNFGKTILATNMKKTQYSVIRHNVTYTKNNKTNEYKYYTNINFGYDMKNDSLFRKIDYHVMCATNCHSHRFNFINYEDVYCVTLTTKKYGQDFSVEKVILDFLESSKFLEEEIIGAN